MLYQTLSSTRLLKTCLLKNGALDEWLSLRSAKPSTAVRIRQAPLKSFYDESAEIKDVNLMLYQTFSSTENMSTKKWCLG